MTLAASDTLTSIAANLRADASRSTITIGELLEKLGGRGLVLITLLFTLPNVFSIPGVSSLLSMIMSFFLLQMMVGKKTAWLPSVVARRSLPEKPLLLAIDKSTPLLKKIERVTKPRLEFMCAGLGLALVCATCLALCVIIFLPLSVVGNLLPAICITIIMVGLLERDGAVVLAGTSLGLAVMAGLYMVVIAAMQILLK